MSTNLDQQIRAALDARKGEWQSIASKSGVSYSWLSKFVNGHIPNPGYETLKKLAACLGVPKSARRQQPANEPTAKAA